MDCYRTGQLRISWSGNAAFIATLHTPPDIDYNAVKLVGLSMENNLTQAPVVGTTTCHLVSRSLTPLSKESSLAVFNSVIGTAYSNGVVYQPKHNIIKKVTGGNADRLRGAIDFVVTDNNGTPLVLAGTTQINIVIDFYLLPPY
jgi:hypothetical protein